MDTYCWHWDCINLTVERSDSSNNLLHKEAMISQCPNSGSALKKCQIYFFILFINRKNQCKLTGSDAQFAGYNKNFLNEKKAKD